eukprot:CAMPEP_0182453604 /NCGR_PEP_ID=MMETSP1319-20130603/602_1 /TAXON_ID=172717 /ORGANISM="Bolidomonas pacifica, Strain RCC208" /LENGTH=234 /DNA_ID=CAMNT_0024651551 /DNA_START=120 /DNA_END=821 /DNA_ORIENTATION=+
MSSPSSSSSSRRASSQSYWHTKVAPLFEPLLASLVVSSPPNPRLWLIKQLGGQAKAAGTQVNDDETNKKQDAGTNPPTPDGKVHPGSDPNVLYSQEAFKVDPTTGERIEADTADSFDAVPLSTILLPGDTFPSDCSCFSISYSSSLLNAWVKQPSPCCGAASVASAVNSLRGHSRTDDGAIGHLDVLPLMASMLREQMEAKRRSLERIIGDAQPLVDRVVEELGKEGRTLGGKE